MNVNQAGARLPGQPIPADANVQAPANTPSEGNALAQLFNQSRVAWNAYMPSALALPASATTPEWLKALSSDEIRGDECFRERFGYDISLLDEEGRIDSVVLNPKKCPLEYQPFAQNLAIAMQARNMGIEDLAKAKTELEAAEGALKTATQTYDEALANGQRHGAPLDDAAVRKCKDERDAAVQKCNDEEAYLKMTRQSLVEKNAQAARLMGPVISTVSYMTEASMHLLLAGRVGEHMVELLRDYRNSLSDQYRTQFAKSLYEYVVADQPDKIDHSPMVRLISTIQTLDDVLTYADSADIRFVATGVIVCATMGVLLLRLRRR